MIQDKRDKEYKAHLARLKRVRVLKEMIKDRPLIPLDKPEQRGWEMFLDLIPEIKRRDDIFEIQQVMDLGFSGLGNWSHSVSLRMSKYRYAKWYKASWNPFLNSVELVKLVRRGETGYTRIDNHGKSHYVDLLPHRRGLNEKEFEVLPPMLKKYFHFDCWDDYYLKTGRKVYYLSHDKFPQYWVRLKARPYFVTHYQSKGGKVEKEISYLEDKIDEYFRLNGPGNRDWNLKSEPHNRTKTRNDIRKFIKGEKGDIEGISHKKY